MTDIHDLYAKCVYQESFVERTKLSQFVWMQGPAEKRLEGILNTIETHPSRLPRKQELEAKVRIVTARMASLQLSEGICHSCKNYTRIEDASIMAEIACDKVSPPLTYADELMAFCIHFAQGDNIVTSAAKIADSTRAVDVQSLRNILKRYTAEINILKETPKRF